MAEALRDITAVRKAAARWKDRLRGTDADVAAQLWVEVSGRLRAAGQRAAGEAETNGDIAELAGVAVAGAERLAGGGSGNIFDLSERIQERTRDRWPRTDFDRVTALAAVLEAYSDVAQTLEGELSDDRDLFRTSEALIELAAAVMQLANTEPLP